MNHESEKMVKNGHHNIANHCLLKMSIGCLVMPNKVQNLLTILADSDFSSSAPYFKMLMGFIVPCSLA